MESEKNKFEVKLEWLNAHRMPSGRFCKAQVLCLGLKWPEQHRITEFAVGLKISPKNRLFFETASKIAKQALSRKLEKIRAVNFIHRIKDTDLDTDAGHDAKKEDRFEVKTSAAFKNPVKKIEAVVSYKTSDEPDFLGNGPFTVNFYPIGNRPGKEAVWIFKVFFEGQVVYFEEGYSPIATKKEMSLEAICRALEWLDGREAVLLISCNYSYKLLDIWAHEFKNNGWRLGPMRKDPPAPHVAYMIRALDHIGRAKLSYLCEE